MLGEQPVEDARRARQVDRRVDQQHALEAELAPLIVEPGDEGSVGRAEAVAGEIVARDLDLALELATDQRHHAVEVRRILGRAGPAGARPTR